MCAPAPAARASCHVLEHLDRDDAVEPALRIEIVHVGGDDLEIVEAACGRLRLNEFALRLRVGHRGDARRRIALRHPQRQRAPAAAELENMLAVGEQRVSRFAPATFFLPPPASSWRRNSSRSICAAGRAPDRRTPPALRNAGHWRHRPLRRSDSSAFPRESLVALARWRLLTRAAVTDTTPRRATAHPAAAPSALRTAE